MADEEEELVPESKGKGLVIVLIAVILLGGGGFAAFLAFSGGDKQAAAQQTPPGQQQFKASGKVPLGKMGPILALEPMVVNLNEPGGSRYLKLSYILELNGELNEEQKKLSMRIHDASIIYVSGLRAVDVLSPKAKGKMKEEFKAIAERALGLGAVRAVMFKEFVLQ